MRTSPSLHPPGFDQASAVPTLQEVVAVPGHGPSAAAFGLALALTMGRAQSGRVQGVAHAKASHGSLLWARADGVAREMGALYGPGLHAFGCVPSSLIIARLKKNIDALRAGLEGVRCQSLAAVLIETETAADLTATRRLKLASEKSGVAVVLVRHSPRACANAARVRWQVQAAHPPDGAARRLTFAATLLKHSSGATERPFIMEWDRDRHVFLTSADIPDLSIARDGARASLSGGVDAVPARRPLAA